MDVAARPNHDVLLTVNCIRRWGRVDPSAGLELPEHVAGRRIIGLKQTGATDLEGVYAVGDIVRGASLVVWAIRDGRDCATAILKRFDAKQTSVIAAE